MTALTELPPAQAAVLAELGDMFEPTQRIAERGRGKWSVFGNALGFLRELERKGLDESEELNNGRGP